MGLEPMHNQILTWAETIFWPVFDSVPSEQDNYNLNKINLKKNKINKVCFFKKYTWQKEFIQKIAKTVPVKLAAGAKQFLQFFGWTLLEVLKKTDFSKAFNLMIHGL